MENEYYKYVESTKSSLEKEKENNRQLIDAQMMWDETDSVVYGSISVNVNGRMEIAMRYHVHVGMCSHMYLAIANTTLP